MITLTVNDAALTECLRTADWLASIPTTTAAWNAQWRRHTRRIIDGIGDLDGVLVAENLPARRQVALGYDELTNPVGVRIWLETITDDALYGTRLATITCQPGQHHHYTGDTETPAEAVAAFLAYLVARLNHQWRAVQLVHGMATGTITASATRLELVVHRDPDGDTDVDLFIDGQPCARVDEYRVDPGRGTPAEADEQRTAREQNLAEASPAARTRLLEIYGPDDGLSEAL